MERKPDCNGKSYSVGDFGMSRVYSTMNDEISREETANCMSPPLSLSDGHMMSYA
jgi:hypothetical protein